MVKNRLNLEPEVQEIFQCVDNGHNFLLSGGAGSGKTYSLVQVIQQLLNENPTSRIACMTYTNAAVKEVESRIIHNNLTVSTIHDFLWENIKHFQKELKHSLVQLVNDESIKKLKLDDESKINEDFFNSIEKGIQYKEYLRLKEGIISHDELLIISNYVFQNYPKLIDIVKDKYPFILIDEYQDSNKDIIKIFLDYFQNTNRKGIIGFFGDSMQSIYDDGIGELNDYITKGKVVEIKKKQNRRNPRKVIELANRLRTDGIIQEASRDPNAPNMSNEKLKEGNIFFFYSENNDITNVKKLLTQNYNWDFENAKETKELNLSHNLIAESAGFKTLMEIYDKEYILDYKNRIKKYIKQELIKEDFSKLTFGEVIHFLEKGKSGNELKKITPTPTMQTFIDNNHDLFEIAKNYNFELFSKIYVSKDQLLDDKKSNEDEENKKGSKRDNLIKHLFKIQRNISLYSEKNYNEFLRITDYKEKLKTIEDKKILKNRIESLLHSKHKTIEEVIQQADSFGICIIGDHLKEFKKKNEYIYNRVKKVQYSEFQNLYNYLEAKSPFSTQHKTKGTEFDNVLVILDNGDWSNYNFRYLFDSENSKRELIEGKSKTKGKLDSFPSILDRTQKIFYVCCTRAKENLAVFYYKPDERIIAKAREWFGERNLIEI